MRPSVVGSSTFIIWMTASFSSTALGVSPGASALQPLFQCDHQAIGQECHEDMGFDAGLQLVMNGPDRKIVLQFLERLLDLDQLQIEPPELSGVVALDVGAQQIAALAPARGACLAIQLEMECLRRDRLIVCRRVDDQQTIGLAGLFLAAPSLSSKSSRVRSWCWSSPASPSISATGAAASLVPCRGGRRCAPKRRFRLHLRPI